MNRALMDETTLHQGLLQRYAALLIGYCTSVGDGDKVLLNIDTGALPLARCLVREVLSAGGEPFLRLAYPEQTSDIVELASAGLLASEAQVQLDEIKAMDAYVRVSASDNSRSLAGADQRSLSALERRLAPVQNWRVRHTRWVGSLFPTGASAQEAGLSSDDYARFVYGAMFLFEDDPATRWRELGARQQRLVERLASAREFHLEGPGTDLRLSTAGRTWLNSDGKRNMPSGEVFTGPLEDSAEGTVTFAIASSVRGAKVENVSLRFERGEVVEATAERGQELLDAQLATDPGARRLGEIGIGTNPNITMPTGSTLFDEKILGTVHLALGRSYQESGGVNESVIHWDLICDLRQDGVVTVDGEPFLESGRLLWLED